MCGEKKRLKVGMPIRAIRGQRGYTLIEVLIATAILGIIAVVLLSAVVVSYHGVMLSDKKTMAQSLTRTEFERIREGAYPVSPYSRTVLGYEVDVDAQFVDPETYLPTDTSMGMQMITVTVSREGAVVLVTQAGKVLL